MPQPSPVLYEFGPYRLNPAQQQLTDGSRRIPLTPKALQTLLVLVEKRGEVVSKEELLEKVWPDTFVEEATLSQNVFTLRKQLQDDKDKVVYIETVPKRGYRFVANVRVEEPVKVGSVLAQSSSIGQKSRFSRKLGYLSVGLTLILAVLGIWRVSSRQPLHSAANRRVMLAVLPVQNLTGNAGKDYFADGLTEEVIADLGSLNPERLGVIARTSAMAYKQSHKTVKEIGKELGVDYVLETSLREGTGNVRFTAQLIRTQDQTHIWAHKYDRPTSDVLALQAELAQTVAEQVQVELPQPMAARIASVSAVKPEAYDAYSKGRFYWNQRTPSAMITSEKYFQTAIEVDPNFAPAYAGLADCYQIMVNLDQLKSEDGFAKAKAAALKALELNDALAEAHVSLASIKGDYEWDWQGAESEYKRALELNPNYATAHHWYGEFLAGLGRFDEATAEIKKGLEVDPVSPVIGLTLGEMYCRSSHCQQGIDQVQRTLTLHPDFAEAHMGLALMYGHLGMYQESLRELKLDHESPASHATWVLGYVSAVGGHKQDALNVLEQWERHPEWPHRESSLAILYAALGDKDKAFANLERARQNHDPWMAYVRADFALESLRMDPRYRDLIRRMKMPA